MDAMQSQAGNSTVVKKKKSNKKQKSTYLCNLILTQPKMTKCKHVTQLAWTSMSTIYEKYICMFLVQ